MKSKTFVILLALCAVLGLATYFVSTADRNSGKKSPVAEDKFLSELPVNDIASISVKDAENEVVLEKGESVWVVKNRFGYPADFGKIAEFAKKLKDAKVGRTFDAADDNRDRLALHSPDEADTPQENKGTRVTLKDKDSKVLADVIIGKPREASSGFGGHYLMTVGGKTVYLVDKDYNYMEKKPSEWIQTDLLDVKAEDVREVVCTDSKTGNVIYTIQRAEKGKEPELVNAPADKKLIPARLNNVIGALAGFTIEDVAEPAAKAEATGTDGIHLTFRLFDGTEYTAFPGRASKEDAEKYYVRVNAAYVQPAEPEKPAEKKAESPAPADAVSAENKPAVVYDKAEEKTAPKDGNAEKSAAPDQSGEKTAEDKSGAAGDKTEEKSVPKDAAAEKSGESAPAEAETKPADSGDKSAAVPENKPEDKTDIAKDAVVTENLDKPLIPDKKDSAEDKAEPAKAEDKPDFAKLAADAAELNKKISAWTYIIPKWKAERLITNVEEFFEKPKPEEKAEDGMIKIPQPGMPQPGNVPFPPAQ